MKLYIKYMVSNRCKLFVKDQLDALNIKYSSIELGVINTIDDLSESEYSNLKARLEVSGLEILENQKAILVESVKNVVVKFIHYDDDLHQKNFSDLISDEVGYDYTYLATVFSEVTGLTIQKYIIMNKIERVKELLIYDELSLTEIAYKLHYSSVAHLSTQFKKSTGLTATYYKGLANRRRRNLEDL